MKEFAFITSQDFEDFTSQLFGLELPGFNAVRGAGGDGGLDGLEGTTAYQMYFADQKNRTVANYVKKIDDTLTKLQVTTTRDGLEVTRMILVTPEDLPAKAVIHLQKKTKETGIECLSWGASQLAAMLAKHPQIRDNFPEVLLPDVKTGVTDIKNSLTRMSVPRNAHNIEIITDEEYLARRNALQTRLRQKYASAQRFPGSAAQTAAEAYRIQMQPEFDELSAKKAASDRSYELERADLTDHFEQLTKEKTSELAQRGVLTSGFGQQDLHDINVRRLREIEKLKLKYGKNKPGELDQDISNVKL